MDIGHIAEVKEERSRGGEKITTTDDSTYRITKSQRSLIIFYRACNYYINCPRLNNHYNMSNL